MQQTYYKRNVHTHVHMHARTHTHTHSHIHAHKSKYRHEYTSAHYTMKVQTFMTKCIRTVTCSFNLRSNLKNSTKSSFQKLLEQ